MTTIAIPEAAKNYAAKIHASLVQEAIESAKSPEDADDVFIQEEGDANDLPTGAQRNSSMCEISKQTDMYVVYSLMLCAFEYYTTSKDKLEKATQVLSQDDFISKFSDLSNSEKAAKLALEILLTEKVNFETNYIMIWVVKDCFNRSFRHLKKIKKRLLKNNSTSTVLIADTTNAFKMGKKLDEDLFVNLFPALDAIYGSNEKIIKARETWFVDQFGSLPIDVFEAELTAKSNGRQFSLDDLNVGEVEDSLALGSMAGESDWDDDGDDAMSDGGNNRASNSRIEFQEIAAGSKRSRGSRLLVDKFDKGTSSHSGAPLIQSKGRGLKKQRAETSADNDPNDDYDYEDDDDDVIFMGASQSAKSITDDQQFFSSIGYNIIHDNIIPSEVRRQRAKLERDSLQPVTNRTSARTSSIFAGGDAESDDDDVDEINSAQQESLPTGPSRLLDLLGADQLSLSPFPSAFIQCKCSCNDDGVLSVRNVHLEQNEKEPLLQTTTKEGMLQLFHDFILAVKNNKNDSTDMNKMITQMFTCASSSSLYESSPSEFALLLTEECATCEKALFLGPSASRTIDVNFHRGKSFLCVLEPDIGLISDASLPIIFDYFIAKCICFGHLSHTARVSAKITGAEISESVRMLSRVTIEKVFVFLLNIAHQNPNLLVSCVRIVTEPTVGTNKEAVIARLYSQLWCAASYSARCCGSWNSSKDSKVELLVGANISLVNFWSQPWDIINRLLPTAVASSSADGRLYSIDAAYNESIDKICNLLRRNLTSEIDSKFGLTSFSTLVNHTDKYKPICPSISQRQRSVCSSTGSGVSCDWLWHMISLHIYSIQTAQNWLSRVGAAQDSSVNSPPLSLLCHRSMSSQNWPMINGLLMRSASCLSNDTFDSLLSQLTVLSSLASLLEFPEAGLTSFVEVSVTAAKFIESEYIKLSKDTDKISLENRIEKSLEMNGLPDIIGLASLTLNSVSSRSLSSFTTLNIQNLLKQSLGLIWNELEFDTSPTSSESSWFRRIAQIEMIFDLFLRNVKSRFEITGTKMSRLIATLRLTVTVGLPHTAFLNGGCIVMGTYLALICRTVTKHFGSSMLEVESIVAPDNIFATNSLLRSITSTTFLSEREQAILVWFVCSQCLSPSIAPTEQQAVVDRQDSLSRWKPLLVCMQFDTSKFQSGSTSSLQCSLLTATIVGSSLLLSHFCAWLTYSSVDFDVVVADLFSGALSILITASELFLNAHSRGDPIVQGSRTLSLGLQGIEYALRLVTKCFRLMHPRIDCLSPFSSVLTRPDTLVHLKRALTKIIEMDSTDKVIGISLQRKEKVSVRVLEWSGTLEYKPLSSFGLTLLQSIGESISLLLMINRKAAADSLLKEVLLICDGHPKSVYLSYIFKAYVLSPLLITVATTENIDSSQIGSLMEILMSRSTDIFGCWLALKLLLKLYPNLGPSYQLNRFNSLILPFCLKLMSRVESTNSSSLTSIVASHFVAAHESRTDSKASSILHSFLTAVALSSNISGLSEFTMQLYQIIYRHLMAAELFKAAVLRSSFLIEEEVFRREYDISVHQDELLAAALTSVANPSCCFYPNHLNRSRSTVTDLLNGISLPAADRSVRHSKMIPMSTISTSKMQEKTDRQRSFALISLYCRLASKFGYSGPNVGSNIVLTSWLSKYVGYMAESYASAVLGDKDMNPAMITQDCLVGFAIGLRLPISTDNVFIEFFRQHFPKSHCVNSTRGYLGEVAAIKLASSVSHCLLNLLAPNRPKSFELLLSEDHNLHQFAVCILSRDYVWRSATPGISDNALVLPRIALTIQYSQITAELYLFRTLNSYSQEFSIAIDSFRLNDTEKTCLKIACCLLCLRIVGVALGQSVYHMDSSIGTNMRSRAEPGPVVHYYLLLLQRAALALSIFGDSDLREFEFIWHTVILFGMRCNGAPDKVHRHCAKIIDTSYALLETLTSTVEFSDSFLVLESKRQLQCSKDLMNDVLGLPEAFSKRCVEFSQYSKGRRNLNLNIKGYSIRAVARSIENKFNNISNAFH